MPRPAKLSRRSHCPVACVLDLLGDRWTMLVVRDLFMGRQYFDEFLKSPEGIATNILTARLTMLMAEDVIEKKPDAKDKRRATYQLTEKGLSLHEVVIPMVKWGLKNVPNTRLMPGSEAAMRQANLK